MDESKTLGGDQDLRTSTLVRHRPIQGESNIDFLGESERSLPPPQDSLPDAGEAIKDFWSMSGNFICRHHVEPRPDHLWPELWKSMGKHAKLKEKQKWSHEKVHLENARKLRGIYFIDPEDTEFKETIKNARKKLETSVAPAMPRKIMKNCGSGGSNKIKNKTCVYSGS